jgi:hypothetical protein
MTSRIKYAHSQTISAGLCKYVNRFVCQRDVNGDLQAPYFYLTFIEPVMSAGPRCSSSMYLHCTFKDFQSLYDLHVESYRIGWHHIFSNQNLWHFHCSIRGFPLILQHSQDLSIFCAHACIITGNSVARDQLHTACSGMRAHQLIDLHQNARRPSYKPCSDTATESDMSLLLETYTALHKDLTIIFDFKIYPQPCMFLKHNLSRSVAIKFEWSL